KMDSTVWAWGINTYGTIGNGTNIDSNVPLQVDSLTGIVAISEGAAHSIALAKDGTVWAWGLNYYGQLGNGTNTDTNVPTQVDSLSGVVAIAGGGSHTLALKGDGTVWAWGANISGQLGNGTGTNSNIPVQVASLTGITAIATCEDISLALKNDGTVWSWGGNGNGELGNGTTTYDNTVPLQMVSLTGVVAVAAGIFHTLALKNDGTLWTCGYNLFGQLGDGTVDQTTVPVQVSGLCSITTAVQETPADAAVTISPNPTSGDVVIDGGRPSALKTVEVTNAMGQRIIATSFTNKREVLDLSAQPSGLYFITIRGEGRPYFGKVIKE
ncbi:MAG: T9SS type A sorting domain-containing protein, partial [Flavobacteriales bacterium]